MRPPKRSREICPRCQTGGKVLADRALSKLLKDDWPRSIEAWEERTGNTPDENQPATRTES